MNIAIFSGSFKPFHNGHRAIIDEVLKTLRINKLIIVPNYCSPFKNILNTKYKTNTTHIKHIHKRSNKVEICHYEVLKKKKTYSIDTIAYIKNKYKNINNLYFIIGADNCQSIKKWKNWDNKSAFSSKGSIKHNVKLVVAMRDGIKIKNRNIKIEYILKVEQSISSTKIRQNHIRAYNEQNEQTRNKHR